MNKTKSYKIIKSIICGAILLLPTVTSYHKHTTNATNNELTSELNADNGQYSQQVAQFNRFLGFEVLAQNIKGKKADEITTWINTTLDNIKQSNPTLFTALLLAHRITVTPQHILFYKETADPYNKYMDEAFDQEGPTGKMEQNAIYYNILTKYKQTEPMYPNKTTPGSVYQNFLAHLLNPNYIAPDDKTKGTQTGLQQLNKNHQENEGRYSIFKRVASYNPFAFEPRNHFNQVELLLTLIQKHILEPTSTNPKDKTNIQDIDTIKRYMKQIKERTTLNFKYIKMEDSQPNSLQTLVNNAKQIAALDFSFLDKREPAQTKSKNTKQNKKIQLY